MKKFQLGVIALAVVLAGTSMAASAAKGSAKNANKNPAPVTMMAPDLSACSSSALCSMENPSGFYVSLTGIDAVPSETGLGMFSDSWQYTDANGNITARSKPIKPAYKWAGAAAIGYNIPGTANNIELSYFWLNSDTHAVNGTGDNPTSFGSVFFSNWFPLAPGADFVSDAHLKYKVEQADLDVGRRYVDASGHFQIHPYAGARYAKLKHNLTFLLGNVKSQYHGIGPMVGFDGHFDFGCGFGAAGKFDAALMMGTVNANSELTFGITNVYKSPNTNRVVSNANMQLGLDYTYMFQNQNTLKLEIGYQVSEYFSPFDIIRGDTSPTDTRIIGLESTNFSYSGPFATLTWHA